MSDLVLNKTYTGFAVQEIILSHLSKQWKCSYSRSTADEESQGIDGFLDGKPVSIKPKTYETKPNLPERISVQIVYYEKVKDGLKIEY